MSSQTCLNWVLLQWWSQSSLMAGGTYSSSRESPVAMVYVQGCWHGIRPWQWSTTNWSYTQQCTVTVSLGWLCTIVYIQSPPHSDTCTLICPHPHSLCLPVPRFSQSGGTIIIPQSYAIINNYGNVPSLFDLYNSSVYFFNVWQMFQEFTSWIT